MNFIRNQRASGQQQASVRSDRVKGGPIVTIEEQQAGKPQASGMSRRLPVPRSRLESIAFWIVGLAVAVLVLLFIVPSLFGAFATALYTSIFVAFLISPTSDGPPVGRIQSWGGRSSLCSTRATARYGSWPLSMLCSSSYSPSHLTYWPAISRPSSRAWWYSVASLHSASSGAELAGL